MAEERPGEIRRLVGFNSDVVLLNGSGDEVLVMIENSGQATTSDGLTREQQVRLRDALTEHLGDVPVSGLCASCERGDHERHRGYPEEDISAPVRCRGYVEYTCMCPPVVRPRDDDNEDREE